MAVATAIGSPPKTPRSLTSAGMQLSRSAAYRSLKPFNESMHESSLRPEFLMPRLSSIEDLKKALQKDADVQKYKYRGEEPAGHSARYKIGLPTPPINEKLCLRLPASGGEGETAALATGDRDLPNQDIGEAALKVHRFNMQTLRRWFKEIDINGQGTITQRELIIALRNHTVLQALFSSIQGLEYTVRTQTSIDDRVVARREETQRIKRILDELDADGSGTMEWHEFVEFFRKTGLLLEYKTRPSLNELPPEDEIVASDTRRTSESAKQANRQANLGTKANINVKQALEQSGASVGGDQSTSMMSVLRDMAIPTPTSSFHSQAASPEGFGF